ncbi:hypothetical protein B0H11DRAFT_2006702, partial [Mycena galericulata]
MLRVKRASSASEGRTRVAADFGQSVRVSVWGWQVDGAKDRALLVRLSPLVSFPRLSPPVRRPPVVARILLATLPLLRAPPFREKTKNPVSSSRRSRRQSRTIGGGRAGGSARGRRRAGRACASPSSSPLLSRPCSRPMFLVTCRSVPFPPLPRCSSSYVPPNPFALYFSSPSSALKRPAWTQGVRARHGGLMDARVRLEVRWADASASLCGMKAAPRRGRGRSDQVCMWERNTGAECVERNEAHAGKTWWLKARVQANAR